MAENSIKYGEQFDFDAAISPTFSKQKGGFAKQGSPLTSGYDSLRDSDQPTKQVKDESVNQEPSAMIGAE